MAGEFRIDVAYCVELDRVVDIHEACVEFFAQSLHTKFSFMCSDSRCRNSRPGGVRVIAANHNKLPFEQRRSPHFKVLDEHADDCYWKGLAQALKEISQNLEPEDQEQSRRRDVTKVTRLITNFIIPTGEVSDTNSEEIAKQLERIRDEPNPQRRSQALRAFARGLGTSTGSLEALVTCFEELRRADGLTAQFSVQSEGSFTYRQVFRQVSMGPVPHFTVHYGGASVQTKRYGKGFVLKFYDKLEGQPVTLYVSNEHLDEYKPACRMLAVIDELQKNPPSGKYVRVYWIGGLEQSDKGWSATFTSLAHVVFRLVDPTQAVQANNGH